MPAPSVVMQQFLHHDQIRSTVSLQPRHLPTLLQQCFNILRCKRYEPILYGWKDGNDHYWCGARDQSDVWNFNKPRVNDLHPTMKPVDLVIRAIRNSSKTHDIVLDPFGGSGTTLIAAQHTGRHARLIELDPRYADVIVRRWQEQTGEQAVREADGIKFDDLAGIVDENRATV